MNATTQILMAARAKIADPANWIKETYARDSAGNEVDSNSENATCFCMLGAMRAACKSGSMIGGVGVHYYAARRHLTDAINHVAGPHLGNIPQFNDLSFTTHDQVMAAFDRAIETSKLLKETQP